MLKRIIVPGDVQFLFSQDFKDLCSRGVLGAFRAIQFSAFLIGEVESSADIPDWFGQFGTRIFSEELISGEANNNRLSALEKSDRVEFVFNVDKNAGFVDILMTMSVLIFIEPERIESGEETLYNITIRTRATDGVYVASP